MSKNNNHENKQTRTTRIIALILAGLMVLGTATLVISLLVEAGHDHSEDNKQTQATTTTHDPSHNH